MAQIIPPRRREDWFRDDGQLTLRALTFLEGLTTTTNNVTNIINETTGQASLNAILIRLQKQVGSGQVLTIDTSGFTVDTSFQFTDQSEA